MLVDNCKVRERHVRFNRADEVCDEMVRRQQIAKPTLRVVSIGEMAK
jgi:hypothetical protein